MKNIFTDDDLKELFVNQSSLSKVPMSPKKYSQFNHFFKGNWRYYSQLLLIFMVIFVSSYTLINFSALNRQLKYFWQVDVQKKYYQADNSPSPSNIFSPTDSARLLIPKIAVNASIIWNVEENNLKDNLLKGAVHSAGTALPGEEGNIFITGHSSYYPWVESEYKNVFTLLDKLTREDIILIEYQSIVFQYQVTNTKVVSANDLSVMQEKSGKNLTLMTCVPVGTNLNRLIVEGKQISTSE